MSRPQLEVADIIRSAGTDFIARNRSWLRWTHLKVLRAIARCRTAALGGHIDECTNCGHRATISYNSCRNRHCPKCQTGARERWIAARRVFRGKFVAGLKSAFERGQLHLAGELAPLANPKAFAPWLRPLFRKDWIVYSKPPFGGPEYVLQYLGRYTHRVAISNHRLVALADGQVTFRWRDSADHNRQKVMTISRDEFLRRLLLHLLPKGFVRIRHFGFLANRRRASLLPLCFAALHTTPPTNESEPSTAPTAHPLWRCPKCGGPMAVVERFTASQLQLRSPPLLATAA